MVWEGPIGVVTRAEAHFAALSGPILMLHGGCTMRTTPGVSPRGPEGPRPHKGLLRALGPKEEWKEGPSTR